MAKKSYKMPMGESKGYSKKGKSMQKSTKRSSIPSMEDGASASKTYTLDADSEKYDLGRLDPKPDSTQGYDPKAFDYKH